MTKREARAAGAICLWDWTFRRMVQSVCKKPYRRVPAKTLRPLRRIWKVALQRVGRGEM